MFLNSEEYNGYCQEKYSPLNFYNFSLSCNLVMKHLVSSDYWGGVTVMTMGVFDRGGLGKKIFGIIKSSVIWKHKLFWLQTSHRTSSCMATMDFAIPAIRILPSTGRFSHRSKQICPKSGQLGTFFTPKWPSFKKLNYANGGEVGVGKKMLC